MNPYLGREEQLLGVEEVRLVGGKGDGMRFYQMRNAAGLEVTVSLDRCADPSRVRFKGDNCGYFAPCGYVAPNYYDKEGLGFLQSFTAGFLTTCGLRSVGNPCTDEGEYCPLHGTVSNIPAERAFYWTENDEIHVKAFIRDAGLSAPCLLLEREYVLPFYENKLILRDRVQNIGSRETPFQMLYHCNVGYPLLSEKSVLSIPSVRVTPRNEHAAEGLADWMKMELPQAGCEERCFYHEMHGKTEVSVYQPDLGKRLTMRYDADVLPYFTEWKMMGEHEYVLGIEPGNALPDGRDVMRRNGILTTLGAGEEKTHTIEWIFTEE